MMMMIMMMPIVTMIWIMLLKSSSRFWQCDTSVRGKVVTICFKTTRLENAII
jgi:hypothetical protein